MIPAPDFVVPFERMSIANSLLNNKSVQPLRPGADLSAKSGWQSRSAQAAEPLPARPLINTHEQVRGVMELNRAGVSGQQA